MPQLPRITVRTRMSGRDSNEPHRASSPLELLFDLTFVVAVAQVASGLARTIAEGQFWSVGLVSYLTVFFAIWLAWINFSWFASAYDTDDVLYRLLTLLQMGGVLVLAAGVPAVFAHQDFRGITLGYVIMRVAMVAQWLRAGVESPPGRITAFRYAGGIAVVQVGWVLRLLLPPELGLASFIVLAVAELAVPLFAERPGLTPWHAQHIAERYSLFTIILLGESVSAATIAVQHVVTASGVHVELVFVAIAGLVLLFAMWWLYFMEHPSLGLAAHTDRVFLWGYGHYFLFAAVAAVGAALEVAVEKPAITAVAVGYALAVPVAVYLVMLPAVTAVLRVPLATPLPASVAAVVLVLLLPLAAPAVGVPGVVTGVAVVAAALTAAWITVGARRGREA
jgi:low temperature requirement protein LtrA